MRLLARNERAMNAARLQRRGRSSVDAMYKAADRRTVFIFDAGGHRRGRSRLC